LLFCVAFRSELTTGRTQKKQPLTLLVTLNATACQALVRFWELWP
jgi:hypothetical protein